MKKVQDIVMSRCNMIALKNKPILARRDTANAIYHIIANLIFKVVYQF